jgi:hypothetical protein
MPPGVWPTLEVVMYDRIGVEVDLSGTWVRYEPRLAPDNAKG